MGCYARVLCGLVVLWTWAANGSAAPCAPWVTRVVSIQGNVEASRAKQNGWSRVQLNDQFCAGDRIRADIYSRAGLLLRNETLLRLDQGTTLVLPQLYDEDAAWLDLVRGAVHFISNIPYRLKIKTPFVNAAIEGTEFAVRVTEADTKVWVLEGKVSVENAQGNISLGAGEAAVAEVGKGPVPYLKIKPRDAVQWALYYPPIIDYRPGAAIDPHRQQAVDFYRTGQIADAMEALNAVPNAKRDSGFYSQRAALLLSVGQVEPAKQDIEKARALAPKSAAPLALQSVIALTRNDKEKALSLAQDAVKLEPRSPIPQVALSYAQQAAFNIDGATESIKKALEFAPGDPLAWARLSELELSSGELSDALDAAKKAEALDPELSRTQMVLGFAQLMEIDIDEAQESFNRAIELDPSAPLPRLGMGLAKIRQGDVEEGRKDIEVAAVLDPENSLIRSYLGKAYYEEKRGTVASREFEMAKHLDPKDPTPWFYDAIYKQTVNKPVEALHDIQKAIELNDNRAVYRSSLLLDDDLAARSAGLARIYSNLGFDKLGLLEGYKSLNSDPTNFSAHRFLSDSYASLPRHEIAQSSELLQAQLLQPINITPLPSQLVGTDLSVLGGIGPVRAGTNEFNPLFNRNRIALQLNGRAGSQHTWGDDFIVSGVFGQFSASASQYHSETAGFLENEFLRQDGYNVFTQIAITPKASFQVEFVHEETDAGDVNTGLNNFHLPELKESRRRTSSRAGLHLKPTEQQDIILSTVYEVNTEIDTDISRPPPTSPLFGQLFLQSDVNADSHGYNLEIQHMYSSRMLKTIIGGGFVDIDTNRHFEDDLFDNLGPTLISTLQDVIEIENTKHRNVYLYSNFTPVRSLTAILGISYDNFEEGDLKREQVNPKFGIVWNPIQSTTLRAAAFRTLKRSLFSAGTIEPTQVAGFNQFFDDLNGSHGWRYGVGLDQKFGNSVYAGIEASWRDIEQPLFDIGANTFRFRTRNEQFHRGYLYWTPINMVSLSAEYRFEYIDRNFDIDNADPKDPTRVSTHIVPLTASFFHPNGFYASIGASYVDQNTNFVVDGSRSGGVNFVDRDHDSFWIFDASIGYRFPKRYGLLNIGIFNMFDNNILFQTDLNPANPRLSSIQRRRAILAEFRLSF